MFLLDTSTASELHRDPEVALVDPSVPGEVELTPELRSAFLQSLATRKISLRFFAGGWTSFSDLSKGTSYDLILSSETIYEVAALPTLVKLFRSSMSGPVNQEENRSLESLTEGLTISTESRCLVAAKVLYFGVGGGIPDFKRAVEGTGGKVQTIWERKVGVGRQIMSVEWDS
jgi:protein-histidine N-methyltransferase